MQRLNARYHGRDIPTDVLAFDLSRKRGEVIADIYISADTALRNAKVFSALPSQELLLYVIHGLLHIAGYNDHSPRDIKLMRKKENFYMRKIGYPWPS